MSTTTATAGRASHRSSSTAGVTGTARDLMTGRTSRASRASVSARGPRLDPVGDDADLDHGKNIKRMKRRRPIDSAEAQRQLYPFSGHKKTGPLRAPSWID